MLVRVPSNPRKEVIDKLTVGQLVQATASYSKIDKLTLNQLVPGRRAGSRGCQLKCEACRGECRAGADRVPDWPARCRRRGSGRPSAFPRHSWSTLS